MDNNRNPSKTHDIATTKQSTTKDIATTKQSTTKDIATTKQSTTKHVLFLWRSSITTINVWVFNVFLFYAEQGILEGTTLSWVPYSCLWWPLCRLVYAFVYVWRMANIDNVSQRKLRSYHIDGSLCGCNISSALAVEILQPCTKPMICKASHLRCVSIADTVSHFSYRAFHLASSTGNTVLYPVKFIQLHYNDVIMSMMASQITSLTTVCSSLYSDADQRKHQSSASLVGNSPVAREFPAQMVSNAENVSIWWRHHVI